ncbi:hypothetical protein [Stenotrophomonas sp. GD03657]|nr:hypothetical protein [Stenotrophomonas sp. GD03657]MDH2154035.1 hypothetical protein [Stenotrophomonas sp. GD03657]
MYKFLFGDRGPESVQKRMGIELCTCAVISVIVTSVLIATSPK